MLISQGINRLIFKARKEKINEIILKTKRANPHSIESCRDNHKDNMNVTDIGIKDGEIFTIAEGFKHRHKGYADNETAMLVAMYKRLFYLIGNNFTKVGILGKIIIALSFYFNRNVLAEWFERMFTLGYYLLKDEYWQRPVKELVRVLKPHFRESMVYATIMILEYDNAYKYRVQDILPEIDKSKLNGYFTARKEILKIYELYVSRESEGYQIKMRGIKKLISLILLLPNINKKIREIIKEINTEKIKFDEVDLYWVKKRPVEDYKFNLNKWLRKHV